MNRSTWTRLVPLLGLALLAVPWNTALAGNPVAFLPGPGVSPPIDTTKLFLNPNWAVPPLQSPTGIAHLYFAKPDPGSPGFSLVDTDPFNPVRIYSQRDGANLYLGVTFPTKVFPFKASDPRLQNPHRVQILIGARSDAVSPITCYRLDYQTFRMINTATHEAIVNDPTYIDQVSWTEFPLSGAATGPINWNNPPTPPKVNALPVASEQALASPGLFEVRRIEHSSGAGFDLKVRIPLAAIFKPAGLATLPNIRFAVALVGDFDVFYDKIDHNPASAFTIPYSVPHYPSTLDVVPEAASPQVTRVPDPSTDPDWLDTSKWADAQLKTPVPPSITFDRTPVYYLTGNAIRVAFQSATKGGVPISTSNWSDLGTPAGYNPGSAGWYNYDPKKPCDIRVFTRVLNTGGPIDPANPPKIRVLMLWGRHGAAPNQWSTMNLTDPFPVVLNDVGNGMILPKFDWPCAELQKNWVHSELSEHPCIATYILPENLNKPGFDAATLAGLSKVPDTFLTNLASQYGVSDSLWAQMNINVVGNAAGLVCEACAPPGNRRIPGPGDVFHPERNVPGLPPGPVPPRINALPAPNLHRTVATGRPSVNLVSQPVPQPPDVAPRATATGDTPVPVPAPTTEPDQARRPAPQRDVIVDFSAWGAIEREKNPRRRTFVLIESLGGAQEFIRREFMDEHQEIPIRFEVANKADQPRIITVTGVLKPPADLKNLRLEFEQPKGVFKPGEVRTVTGLIRKVKGDDTPPIPTPPGTGNLPPVPGKSTPEAVPPAYSTERRPFRVTSPETISALTP